VSREIRGHGDSSSARKILRNTLCHRRDRTTRLFGRCTFERYRDSKYDRAASTVIGEEGLLRDFRPYENNIGRSKFVDVLTNLTTFYVANVQGFRPSSVNVSIKNTTRRQLYTRRRFFVSRRTFVLYALRNTENALLPPLYNAFYSPTGHCPPTTVTILGPLCFHSAIDEGVRRRMKRTKKYPYLRRTDFFAGYTGGHLCCRRSLPLSPWIAVRSSLFAVLSSVALRTTCCSLLRHLRFPLVPVSVNADARVSHCPLYFRDAAIRLVKTRTPRPPVLAAAHRRPRDPCA